MRGRASCYWGASERRRNMVWLSSGKLHGVFRDAWPVYCQYIENDHAVAPVRLRLVRNLRRSMVSKSGTREKRGSRSSFSIKSLSGNFMCSSIVYIVIYKFIV